MVTTGATAVRGDEKSAVWLWCRRVRVRAAGEESNVSSRRHPPRSRRGVQHSAGWYRLPQWCRCE